MRRIIVLVSLFFVSSVCSWAQFHAIDNPTGVIMDSDLNVWATSFTDNTVVKYQGNGSGGLTGAGQFGTGAVQLGVFGVGSNPTRLACDCSILAPSSKTIWVTNFSSNNVTKLDMETGTRLGTFSVGAGPRGLAIDQTSVWVANSLSNTVTQLNKQTGLLIGTYPVGAAPYDVASDGANIWVANRNSNTVMKLSGGSSGPAGTMLSITSVAAQPQALLWDGTNIWVTSYSGNAVSKLQGSTGAVLNATAISAGPIAMADDGCSLWVSSYASSRLTQVNLTTAAVVAVFAQPTVLPNPYGIVVHSCASPIITTSYTGNEIGAFILVTN